MAVASRLSEFEAPICDEALRQQIKKAVELIRAAFLLRVIDERQYMTVEQQLAMNKLRAWAVENER
jgi:hypothetical protein